MMKRLITLLEIISLIVLIIPGGFSQNKALTFISFTPSKVEFIVDKISDIYAQHIDVTGSIDADIWELFCELDIVGIPRERFLFALGINPFDTFFTPFNSKVRLAGGKRNNSVFIPRLNIIYKPSWSDEPGFYQGSILFSYRHISNGKEEFTKIYSLPITITIKPIFSVTILSDSRRKIKKPQDTINITPNTLSFLVPRPGEWESMETLMLEIKTNNKNWSVQCKATELVEYEESKKYKNKTIPPIPPSRLYIKVGNNDYLQLSNSYITILTGNKKGEFTIPLDFKLKTDESVLAGEYMGSLTFLFQGGL